MDFTKRRAFSRPRLRILGIAIVVLVSARSAYGQVPLRIDPPLTHSRNPTPSPSGAKPTHATFGQVRPASPQEETPRKPIRSDGPFLQSRQEVPSPWRQVQHQEFQPKPVRKNSLLELDLTPPSGNVLFRTESEADFLARLQEKARNHQVNLVFPRNTPIEARMASQEALGDITFVPAEAEVCHPPLHFGNDRVERYGVFHPFLQPGLSTARFWWDSIWLPRRALHHRDWECGNGY